MGRIFEVRKSTMFARYDRMAKQFSRVGKEIAIAVKKGGPDPFRLFRTHWRLQVVGAEILRNQFCLKQLSIRKRVAARISPQPQTKNTKQ